mmetsp:Transcript_14882/g.28869  ORF Transcript_14882/g.28869 Transcript_14882/m.28869 type:complete len:292 (+) Transcript_14882:132-1007(+)|eukprot:CAMPEP_0171489670 /NCGR_PEP_ID=MMETSP0958-20121227/2892_1 /TAXON_ID=87120 /ORGANISM="Aurantiochytrium limacinum, Strain ATCCMYA-1381" /LENGTH=291 /DNA_ID=CAMNT_0012022921 /DNA_START=102 /DNA_END=977 /DNA_ORIENTATION=+
MGALQSKLMAFMRQEESSGETGLAATGGTNAEDESVAAYKDPAFHDRLRKDWPEDGDQLHSGGWDMTKKLLEEIETELKKKNLGPEQAKLLDLCCGEGSTAIYFAKQRGWNVVGIDISDTAIAKAKQEASKAGVQDHVDFVAGSAFSLPFPPKEFQVIYGQDPDALSLAQRPACLQGCFETLKSGGIFVFHHHWIPGQGWPKETLEKYCAESGSDPVCADDYIRDLKAAGFQIEIAEDITSLASSHLHGQLKNMQARVAKEGGTVQNWLVKTCEYLDNGHKFGIRVVARKP